MSSFLFYDPATTEIYTLSLHDALPISFFSGKRSVPIVTALAAGLAGVVLSAIWPPIQDRKSTRLNSSHVRISYAVFCLKKKKKINMLYATKSNIILFTVYLRTPSIIIT